MITPPPPGQGDELEFIVPPPVDQPPDPVKPTTHEPILDLLTRGLPEIQRSKVIAAWSRLEDAESSFPGSLAIVLASSATFTAREIKNAVAILQELPANLAHASSALTVVVADQGRALDELRTTVDEVKLGASGVVDTLKAMESREKKQRWRDAALYVGIVLTLLISGSFAFSGLSSAHSAKELVAAQEKLESRNDLAMQVLRLSWERSLILNAKSQARAEDAAIRKKAQNQELSPQELQDLAFIKSRWDELCRAEQQLSEKEEALRGKLNAGI